MYLHLLEALRGELEAEGLFQLPKDFYLNVQAYIQSLKDRGKASSEVESELADEEIKLAYKIMSIVVSLRLIKIIRHILSGKSLPPENLLEEEVEPYNKIKASIEDFLSLTVMFASLEEGVFAKKILVRFVRDVPAFVGVDLKTYGPFQSEDVAYLPLINAEALVKRGVAEMFGGDVNESS
ncbi:MAG: hypothetical protein NDF56_03890 [archaeon GB-1845-036]|nr:DNA replication complex GINS family protein [Candidatus Verstraetearchaeota archaeon]MCS7374102.1 hypothetical protein [Candidatus Culexmicrobium thermophilum]RLE56166.1 MAG: hypothetical protein DRJ30_02770 [Candidatus Verstraetearchaeota archaeon]HDO20023.1 DNA replication complex GINS family protein [Candidatus Bathyarchaeota archaeon]